MGDGEVGFEPTRGRLTTDCSTAELLAIGTEGQRIDIIQKILQAFHATKYIFASSGRGISMPPIGTMAFIIICAISLATLITDMDINLHIIGARLISAINPNVTTLSPGLGGSFHHCSGTYPSYKSSLTSRRSRSESLFAISVTVISLAPDREV